MTDIFVSYARADENRVTPFAAKLEGCGWSVFLDRSIPGGQEWRTHISEALTQSRCIVVFWSRHSIVSPWVHDEAEEGRRRKILIPVLIDKITPPLGFRSLNAVDLAEHSNDRFFTMLVPSIKGLLISGQNSRLSIEAQPASNKLSKRYLYALISVLAISIAAATLPTITQQYVTKIVSKIIQQMEASKKDVSGPILSDSEVPRLPDNPPTPPPAPKSPNPPEIDPPDPPPAEGPDQPLPASTSNSDSRPVELPNAPKIERTVDSRTRIGSIPTSKNPASDGRVVDQNRLPAAKPHGPAAPRDQRPHSTGKAADTKAPPSIAFFARPIPARGSDGTAPRPPTPSATVSIGGALVDLWRPPVGAPPFPLVLFSHNVGGCRNQSAYLMAALAQAGMVVAAPDHADQRCGQEFTPPSLPPDIVNPALWDDARYAGRRVQLRELHTALLADPTVGPLIDSTMLALVGYSLGGYTVLGLAGALPGAQSDGLRVVVALAPYLWPYVNGGTPEAVKIPVLIQAGDQDGASIHLDTFLAKLGGPACTQVFAGAEHWAWVDAPEMQRIGLQPEYQATTAAAAVAFIRQAFSAPSDQITCR